MHVYRTYQQMNMGGMLTGNPPPPPPLIVVFFTYTEKKVYSKPALRVITFFSVPPGPETKPPSSAVKHTVFNLPLQCASIYPSYTLYTFILPLFSFIFPYYIFLFI
jgi:hypothetical protein